MGEAESGGSSSLQILLKALEPQFRRISRRHSLDGPDAEDALQNTLVRFTPLRKQIHEPASWLAVTFRRECLRLLGKRSRALLLDRNEDAMELASSETPPLGPEARMDLAAAIETLPKRQRWVLWQRFGLGLSGAELAEVMGCKVVSAKKAVSRALEALREIYRLR
jgi:RNA polymerase sigma factor (sigma-70 family)